MNIYRAIEISFPLALAGCIGAWEPSPPTDDAGPPDGPPTDVPDAAPTVPDALAFDAPKPIPYDSGIAPCPTMCPSPPQVYCINDASLWECVNGKPTVHSCNDPTIALECKVVCAGYPTSWCAL